MGLSERQYLFLKTASRAANKQFVFALIDAKTDLKWSEIETNDAVTDLLVHDRKMLDHYDMVGHFQINFVGRTAITDYELEQKAAKKKQDEEHKKWRWQYRILPLWTALIFPLLVLFAGIYFKIQIDRLNSAPPTPMPSITSPSTTSSNKP
jgi:hypothetical protein